MTRELREIPPAWRHVRWSTAVWCRWPLGVLGFGLVVYGSLVALMLFHARSANAGADRSLDAGARVAVGRVVAVEPRRGGRENVRYRFVLDDGNDTGEGEGEMVVPAGQFAVGDEPVVQFLAAEPATNRLDGLRRDAIGDLSTPILGFAVFPGILLLLLWLQSVIDLRLMLARGDAGRAEILEVRPVPMIVPVVVRVEYRFRDYRARWCRGSHWVRARSPLGVRLCAGEDAAVVVSDRRHPYRSRLVAAADFAVEPSPEATWPRARSA